ncbi:MULTISPECIES: hypothetical protein [Neobacillus]|uniref:BTB domain-containing protein n=1 Tax=Neobacillus sedimentimangrovi TaxID=2699460 RepID=A0ABS8QLT2_9BACI|nr:hypothetical protein [Neobacillus sedimentimangrovi]AIM15493.1 hypothetical protein HW35_03610 [Bacillus sp. X1(2014)]MCD4839776.1 hypothetical protein [Neobacillus sedimentimangrovi]
MQVLKCRGYELEKQKSNTSEDFFNRSEITFVDDGKERTLHVLYLRYFDEIFQEFTPFEQDPIFSGSGYEVHFKDIVALVCLLKNPGLRERKRLYINSKYEFASYFQNIHFDKLREIFESLHQKNSYDLRSPLEFILQTN